VRSCSGVCTFPNTSRYLVWGYPALLDRLEVKPPLQYSVNSTSLALVRHIPCILIVVSILDKWVIRIRKKKIASLVSGRTRRSGRFRRNLLNLDADRHSTVRPDAVHHGICLPDGVWQGIFVLDARCQGIFLLDAAVSGHFPSGRSRVRCQDPDFRSLCGLDRQRSSSACLLRRAVGSWFGSRAVFVQLTGAGKYFPLFQVKSKDVPRRSVSCW